MMIFGNCVREDENHNAKWLLRSSSSTFYPQSGSLETKQDFKTKKIPWKYVINNIIVVVSLIGNRTNLTSYVNMAEFVFLKSFKIDIHP